MQDKILVIATRASPYNPNKINGGLEKIQHEILVSLSKKYHITVLGYENDIPLDNPNVTFISCGEPLGSRFTPTVAAAVKRKLNTHDLLEFKKIITFEITKGCVDVIAKYGIVDRIINVVATPLSTRSRAILGLYSNALYNYNLGGKNYVQSNAFLEIIKKYQEEITCTGLLTDPLYTGMCTEFKHKDIFEKLVVPPLCMHEKPVVKPATGVPISAQRWDPKFRNPLVAYSAIKTLNGVKYCPSKWSPKSKKYQNDQYIRLDVARDVIQESIAHAPFIVNTCDDSGTVENGSLEAISKGVPVIQLVKRGYPHATIEWDPDTIVVYKEHGETQADVIDRYTKACFEFKPETLERRQQRADRLYQRFNQEEYLKTWTTIIES